MTARRTPRRKRRQGHNVAIDTRERRAAVVAIPYPWASVSVTPTAAQDQEWRQEAGWGYPGILAAASGQALILGDLTTLFVDYAWNTLKDADPLVLDVDTLIRDDLSTVIAAVTDRDDYNTMYTIYLS